MNTQNKRPGATGVSGLWKRVAPPIPQVQGSRKSRGPSQVTSRQVTSRQVRSSQVTSRQVTSSQVKSSHVKSGQVQVQSSQKQRGPRRGRPQPKPPLHQHPWQNHNTSLAHTSHPAHSVLQTPSFTHPCTSRQRAAAAETGGEDIGGNPQPGRDEHKQASGLGAARRRRPGPLGELLPSFPGAPHLPGGGGAGVGGGLGSLAPRGSRRQANQRKRGRRRGRSAAPHPTCSGALRPARRTCVSAAVARP